MCVVVCVYVVYARVCVCVYIQQIDGSVDSLDFVAFRFCLLLFSLCLCYLFSIYVHIKKYFFIRFAGFFRISFTKVNLINTKRDDVDSDAVVDAGAGRARGAERNCYRFACQKYNNNNNNNERLRQQRRGDVYVDGDGDSDCDAHTQQERDAGTGTHTHTRTDTEQSHRGALAHTHSHTLRRGHVDGDCSCGRECESRRRTCLCVCAGYDTQHTTVKKYFYAILYRQISCVVVVVVVLLLVYFLLNTFCI